MEEERKQELNEKMLEISSLIEQETDSSQISVENITFYQNFEFKGSGFEGNNIFIAKVQDSKNNSVSYEIYSEGTNSLIATVDEHGRLHFMPEYIEKLREDFGEHFKNLNLEDLSFALPEEIQIDEISLSKEEISKIKEEKELARSKSKNSTNNNEEQEKEEREQEGQEEQENQEEQEEKENERNNEEAQREEIAAKKGVPSHSVLFIRENSNFYKDHPQLEPNLYFYRDSSGVIKAEYLDKDGNSQPSKFFEDSRNCFKTRNS